MGGEPQLRGVRPPWKSIIDTGKSVMAWDGETMTSQYILWNVWQPYSSAANFILNYQNNVLSYGGRTSAEGGPPPMEKYNRHWKTNANDDMGRQNNAERISPVERVAMCGPH